MNATAPFIDIAQTVFPVVALQGDGQMARMDFYGTAFAVAPGVFMTAAHVVTAAEQAGKLALAGPASRPHPGQPLGVVEVTRSELFADRDIALLWCNAPGVTLLDTWLLRRAQVLTDVTSFGFPHAVTWSPTGDQLHVVFRAYKGYVITTRGFERLPGPPAIYEVSCPFPEGLSGAPLLMPHENMLIVLGVVLGTETVTYGGVSQSVGIAMMADQIFDLESQALGGRIAERLKFSAAQILHGPAGNDGPLSPPENGV